MKFISRNFRIATAISAIYADASTEVVAAAKTPLTRADKYAARIAVLEKRIVADTEALAAVRLESETAGRLDSVVAGTAVVARLGRAGSPERVAVAAAPAAEAVWVDGALVTAATEEVAAIAYRAATGGTLREVAARVLGYKEEADGSLRYKIQHGEGIDTDVDVIQASQIVSIIDETVAA